MYIAHSKKQLDILLSVILYRGKVLVLVIFRI